MKMEKTLLDVPLGSAFTKFRRLAFSVEYVFIIRKVFLRSLQTLVYMNKNIIIDKLMQFQLFFKNSQSSPYSK